MASDDRNTSPCGGIDHAPCRPENRAGLSRIAYRMTTQPEAFARMLWRLPRQALEDSETGALGYPLGALRTRDLEDPTISLIDAYAMACALVSFYSERIANEGFIGTATQRRSVLELARMIGYKLAPGVAASAHLAFTVEDTDDPYRVVQIGAGVQAMSIPREKDKLPQLFETIEAITARAEWNAIHARTQRPQHLALHDNLDNKDDARNGTLYLFDLDQSFGPEALQDPDLVTITAEADLEHYHPLTRRLDLASALTKRKQDHAANNEINPALYALPVDEVCLRGLGLGLRKGARILAVGQAGKTDAPVTAIPLRVVIATEDRAFGLTKVVLTRSGSAPEKVRRSPPFLPAKLLVGVMPIAHQPLNTKSLETYVRGKTWSGDGLTALVQSQSWQRAKMMTLTSRLVMPPPDEEEGKDTALGLHVMRESAGFFGSTAPLWDTLNYGGVENGMDKDPYTHPWDGTQTGGTANTIWMNALGRHYIDTEGSNAHVYLDRELKELQPNGWAIIENASGGALGLRVTHSAVESRADYGITGKSTGVGLRTADDQALALGSEGSTNIYNSFLFRSSQIHALSEHLPLSGAPLSAELLQGSVSVELDRLYLDLERGRPVSLSGARHDAEGIVGRETHLIDEVQHIDGITRLLLAGQTTYPYDRTSVRINANVALATHGESVVEDLGSGDARLTFQTFTLKKPPLTFVSAANEQGRRSTLKVRVDGQLWAEVPTLGQAGADDAVYEVRQSDDGKSHIRFGDGRTGRRLPTGELNVTAEYRSGIGFDGEVQEEAISQLKTRPLGVRAVVNPSPATGAGDAETLDSARLNAPSTVKTLGRVVSLSDYEDFALAFAGVGKAQARELWSGEQKVVHLSIASEADAELTESDTLLANLTEAISKVRDPRRPLIVQPYRRRYFAMTAQIVCDSDYRTEDVVLWARRSIEEIFGYDARQLTQSVSAAEVISALQAVLGVVSVDLDALAILLDGSAPDTSGISLQSVLPALPAMGPGQRAQSDGFSAAELLTVLSSSITLTVLEAVDA